MSPRQTSFMKSLFHGCIEEELVFPYPELQPAERDTLRPLLKNLQRFGQTEVDSAQIDRDEEISGDLLERMRVLGLFGLAIPERYGGLGLGATAHARVTQELGAIDASIAVTLGAHQSIGAAGIELFGTEQQKQAFLPSLATGEKIASFALTERDAGSDAASISTHARLADDGQSFQLSGSKIWVANGGIADVFTVFARTRTPESGKKPGVTAFLVTREDGLRTGPNNSKMGIRGVSTTDVFLDAVSVPRDRVLGEIGKGFKVAMDVLNRGRLGLAAGCVGMARRLIGLSTERAIERRAFGRPIGEFGMIKQKIARMSADLYALESMTYQTTGMIDGGHSDYSLESAICKIFGSETLWSIANESLQIAAGIGYMGNYPYERLLRDARIHMIFEGTNEILRAFVALAGLQSPSERLTEVSKALREPIKGFGLLSEFALTRARSMIRRDRLERAHPRLKRESVVFEGAVVRLAQATEQVLRRHGPDVTEMQFVQRRLAEVAIDLYSLACTLSRTTMAIEQKGENGAQREIHLMSAYCDRAERRLKERFDGMERDTDELQKQIAAITYKDGGYLLDIF